MSSTQISENSPGNDSRARLYPRVTSFRSRKGALTPNQQATWDQLWPRIGHDVDGQPLDLAAWFGRTATTVVEVGCGTGSATVAMAAAEPGVNLLAVDVYKPGLAQLLHGVARTGVDNVRVVRGDAVVLFEQMLAPDSLDGVRVFFPDPWPKSRHHKRRLLKTEVFDLIASRLRPGGVLHVATDHADYAVAIRAAGDACAALTPMTWEPPMSLERPVTKFEGKAERVGNTVTELLWGRITT